MEKEREMFKVTVGNEMSGLADALCQELFFHDSHPFEGRLVIVPDPALKDFLFQHLASDSRLKVAAGLQILPLNHAVMEILDKSSAQNKEKRIPTFPELTLAIEEKLRAYCEQNRFPELNTYLQSGSLARIASFSDELARIFGRYGLFGAQFLPRWLETTGWQQSLFKDLFHEHSPWTYPLESLKKCSFQGKVALFGFSYLSPAHLSFFHSLSASVYLLSPSALFWEDILSDKQRLFVQKALQKTGAKENVRDEMDRYMQEGHTLLGNWGRLGQEMLKALGNFSLVESDAYREPEGEILLSALKRSFLNLDALLISRWSFQAAPSPIR
ncbi:MAG: exodeoxyribonuclease V subunit gamma [Candidatus Melainabacteria bacterium]|nr:exodeoxyribonuclease V subunit gamma [Candidatus Melainabacteria bacterium]